MSETSDVPVSVGALRISQERARQMREERWSHAHDDEHIYGELAKAAACLACRGTDAEVCDPSGFVEKGNMDSWGLAAKHWRDRVRCLEIAGALIAAELDREIRAASEAAGLGDSTVATVEILGGNTATKRGSRDAAFIVHARTALPAALDEIERLREQVAALRRECYALAYAVEDDTEEEDER